LNIPKVYVILLNWNGYKDTSRCLKSLRKSLCPVNIIVVDNLSTERDIEQILSDFPEVEFIQSNENGGFAKGNNIGIKSALSSGADYIYILNNDTLVEEESISILFQFMESHVDVVAASPFILYGDDPELIWYGGGDFVWAKGGARSTRLNKKIDYKEEYLPEKSKFISGCAMFIRASVLEKIGGFDENYFMYVEDIELAYRLSQAGEMYFIPDAKVFHYAHSTAKKNAENYFMDVSSHLNPQLNFFLKNVLNGYFYFLQKHRPKIINYISFILYFYLKWLKMSIVYMLKGRADSSVVILKALITREKL
jgi:GT2 family glycosyltransferase